MPTYEYKCNKCGVTSEILVRNIASAKISCPQCLSTDMEKMITAPAAVKAKGGSPHNHPMPSCPNKNVCGNGSCPAHFD